ncbi:MFS transporter [Asanoa ferruginea]|nr:MFS transporter [Asanoa ferruginea]
MAAHFFTSVGFGLYSTGTVIYFNRVVGLSPSQVGIGLSVSGLLWIALAVPVGRLVDRVGPREAAVVAGLSLALALAVAAHARSFETYLAVIAAVGFLEQTAIIAGNALLAGVVADDDRVPLLALLRSVFNVGLTVGVLLTGLAVAAGSPAGYRWLFLGAAAAAAAAAAVTTVQPRVAGAPAGGRGPWSALADLPYVSLAVVGGLVTVHDVILGVGLPLWIVSWTQAPAAVAAWVIGLNTVLVVALQVRASRLAVTVDGARRLQRRACVAVALACVVFGLTRGPTAGPATALLILGVVVLTAGELWSSAANWRLRFAFADPTAQGQYAGVFSLGIALRGVIGPVLVATLIGGLRSIGWIVLALFFALMFLLINPVVETAGRRLRSA